MEFRDAIRTYLRRRWLGIGILILTVAGAYGWQMLQPVRYSTSMSLGVNRVNADQTPDYQFDGYYALQAADLFSQTLVSWMQTPSILVEIYDQAGLPTDVDSIRGLTSRFKTKKVAAQNVVVTYSSPTQAEAEKLATAITAVTTRLTATVNRSADNKAFFELVAAKPVIVKAKMDPVITGVAAGMVGLVLALFLVPFVAYVSAASRQS
ncbi:MAG: hypothetical protein HY976_00825 [Candidatus Kerfeldbacteria bacterium]|nr:hypothetical protein [Candidatus Kerfeldbacteria bacterium]